MGSGFKKQDCLGTGRVAAACMNWEGGAGEAGGDAWWMVGRNWDLGGTGMIRRQECKNLGVWF